MDKTSKTPLQYFAFTKNNKPDGKYLAIEVWPDGSPNRVKGRYLEIDANTFSTDETKLDSLIAYWEKVASDEGFEKPMITIQADFGIGSELAYAYTDGREEVPPNAKSYTIKPRFDKNIFLMRTGGDGKSLVYSSPLDSPTIREEISNFNKLLVQFFNGAFYEVLTEYSDRDMGWELLNDLVIDNAKLRSPK
ncbi:MAG: hypothetical protein Q7S45_04640 [Candidatus Curtissbacteria bacterium]|nr:hypothetical protein [Candidatus Curtissbacteria bacterium]